MQGISEIQKDLSSYTLKNLAIFAMFFDHIFAVFVPQDSLEGVALRILGRIAAPIMCYMIAEGYHYTSNLKKYIVRLALFAAVSHFPYVWYFGLPWWQATSVIWGLALGLVALAAAKREDWSHPLKVFIVLICCLLAVPADWNYVAVLWILFFGLFRGQIEKQLLSFAIIGILFHIIPSSKEIGWTQSYQIGIFLAMPLLLFYKGRQGKKSNVMKWGFYAFYPFHLLLLELVKMIVSA